MNYEDRKVLINTETLNLNEIFYSIQGEGFNQGLDALFIRFGGCNLWSGIEEHRKFSKTCGQWCDTDFSTKLKVSYQELITLSKSLALNPTLIVFTGGEPTLQLTEKLINSVQQSFPNTLICVETNGTTNTPLKGCFVTVSPKENTKLLRLSGDELKIVIPQTNLDIEVLSELQFKHYYFQPKNSMESLKHILPLLKKYPKFKLSIQLHKLIGVR